MKMNPTQVQLVAKSEVGMAIVSAVAGLCDLRAQLLRLCTTLTVLSGKSGWSQDLLAGATVSITGRRIDRDLLAGKTETDQLDNCIMLLSRLAEAVEECCDQPPFAMAITAMAEGKSQ